jgi:hypothetical protein
MITPTADRTGDGPGGCCGQAAAVLLLIHASANEPKAICQGIVCIGSPLRSVADGMDSDVNRAMIGRVKANRIWPKVGKIATIPRSPR